MICGEQKAKEQKQAYTWIRPDASYHASFGPHRDKNKSTIRVAIDNKTWIRGLLNMDFTTFHVSKIIFAAPNPRGSTSSVFMFSCGCAITLLLHKEGSNSTGVHFFILIFPCWYGFPFRSNLFYSSMPLPRAQVVFKVIENIYLRINREWSRIGGVWPHVEGLLRGHRFGKLCVHICI